MARIRSVKPEFWDSPSTARASLRARLFYIAMWNWADDWGVGDANPRRLLGFAFPSDEASEVEPRNFRHLASEVAECYGVAWYEVEGRTFYVIPSWEQHQRTEKKARRTFPPPDQAERFLYTSVSEVPTPSSGSSDEGSRKGEVGSRKWEGGAGEGGLSSAVADATARPEIDALLDLLDRHIRENGAKVPSRTRKNLDATRLLIDKDGHTPTQIAAAIEWCQADEFWRSNILSMSKLREKYDQLRLAAQRAKATTRTTDRQGELLRREMELARQADEATHQRQIGAAS